MKNERDGRWKSFIFGFLESLLIGKASRFRTAWCLIAVSLVSALGWVVLRWHYEHKYRRVEIVVDYGDVCRIADASRVPRARFLRALKRAGLTGVALSGQTLATLSANGRITVDSSDEVAPLFPALRREFAAAPGTFFLWNRTDAALVSNIERHLREQAAPGALPRAVILPNGGRGLFVAGGKQTINEAGLGFDAAQVDQVRQVGLHPVAQLSNRTNLTARRVALRLDEARDIGARFIWFEGHEVFGYATLLPLIAQGLRERDLSLGAFEFSTQLGLPELCDLSAGNLLRVHSVSPDETARLRPEVLAERYARSARERNVRVLFVRLLQPLKHLETAGNRVLQGDGVAQNTAFLTAIRRNLGDAPSWARQGPGRLFSLALGVGDSAPFGDYPRTTLKKRLPQFPLVLWGGTFLVGLGALGAWLLLAHLFFDLSSSKTRTLTITGLTGIALVSALGPRGAKLLAFAVACPFPIIALAWSGWPEAVGQSAKVTYSIVATSLRVVVRMMGVALCGGFLVAALLSDWHFFSKTEDFWGTKPAQMVPLGLILLLVTGGFWPAAIAREGARAAQRRAWRYWRRFLVRPFTLRMMLIGLIVAGALWLWMARSGNESGVTVSDFEWRFRALLEKVLMARPRNKEMFLAYPALVISVWCARRGFSKTATLAGMIGIIAPIDVLNSFCQANNPLALALWRSIAGAAVGTVLGLLAVGVCDAVLVRPTVTELRVRFTPSRSWRRAIAGALGVALLIFMWRTWRAERRYEFVSAPVPQATWPWPDSQREELSRGVTHWLDRSTPDGTTLELFEFDFQSEPQLHFALYDQDEDDEKPFDNRAFYWNKGLAPVTRHIAQKTPGDLVALWNGAFFGLENQRPRARDRAFHLSPVVLDGRAYYAQANHRWTLGTRHANEKQVQFEVEHLPSPAELAKFDFSMGAAQCVVKNGRALRLRAYPHPGETPQPPPVPSTPEEAGHIPILDFMKTSRVSLGWNRDSSKLWLLFVKEPDGESPSREAVLQNRPAWGGWRLDDVQRFWLAQRKVQGDTEGVETALVTDGGDVAQLAFRRGAAKGDVFEMVPPRFSTPQGSATRRYLVSGDNHDAPPCARLGGALTYCYIWRDKS